MLNKLFSGIFGHFLLRVTVIQTLVGISILAILLPYYDYAVRDFAAEQGRTVANSTLSATTDALYTQDYSSIVDYCINVMKVTPNVLFIAFSERNGRELIVRGDQWAMKNKTLPYYAVQFPSPKLRYPVPAFLLDYDGPGLGFSDYYNFSRPISLVGKEWGVLTISFSNSAYLSSIKTFNQLVIVFTIISCLLSLTLFFLSSRRIRKQIDAFGAVTDSLSRGDLLTRAPESAIGEIATLGKAINSMSVALQDKSKRISQLTEVVEQTKDAMVLLDGAQLVIYANDAFKNISGFATATIVGLSLTEFLKLLKLTDQLEGVSLISLEAWFGQGCDVQITKSDQTQVDVAIRMEAIEADSGDEYKTLLVISDISERKLAETEFRIAATAFESQEGMIVTDVNNVILRVNQAFTTITAYEATDAIGQTPKFLNSGLHEKEFYNAMWESIDETGAWKGDVWNRRKNGEVRPHHLTITAVKDNKGDVTNYVATLIDITLRKAEEEKIQQLAFYDSLTDLPNRRLLIDRINQAMATSSRSGQRGALLFLDLDHFKTLNDTLGHDVGDLLLQQVAARLTACVREGDTVARLGGDEFVLLLEGLNQNDLEAANQTEVIGNKILIALNQAYQLASHEHYSTPSIGATLFVDHSSGGAEALLKQADVAMYQAKTAGRNALHFFDPQMQTNIQARVDFEAELRKAIEQDQFELHHQIQVNSDGHPLGAEALVRWKHPKYGMVQPTQYISLAEETGLILSIGQWVLDAACTQLRLWQKDAITSNLTLSVNVSAKQIRQADFVAQVQTTIQRHGVNPARLILELSESVLLDYVEDTIAVMNALKSFGIKFALDDFGTGYLSLQYLNSLPLYQLKIDQSFMRDLNFESNRKAIVRIIIAMANILDIDVIAEGVETEEQRQLLFNMGCVHYQGYLFSKPVPINKFEALLNIRSLAN